jgi:hypothetical protein
MDLFGTLILTLPCKQGVVVCADKSLSNAEGMVSQAEIKVRQLGTHAAFAVTNLVQADSLDGGPRFEPLVSIPEFFASKNPRYIDRHKLRLEKMLRDSLERTYNSRHTHSLPPERAESQAIIWHVDTERNVHGFRVEVTFDGSQARRPDSRIIDIDMDLPSLTGHTDPFSAIWSRRHPRFDCYRDDRRFERMASTPEQWKMLDAETVAETGQFVIRACSESQPITTPGRQDISAESDCCLLDRDYGFRWLVGGPVAPET